MKTTSYQTTGTCSRRIDITLDDDGTIRQVRFLGGCNGNLQGICRLVEGQKAADVIERVRGIRCGDKPTSCPDQLAHALSAALSQQ